MRPKSSQTIPTGVHSVVSRPVQAIVGRYGIDRLSFVSEKPQRTMVCHVDEVPAGREELGLVLDRHRRYSMMFKFFTRGQPLTSDMKKALKEEVGNIEEHLSLVNGRPHSSIFSRSR